MDGSGLSRAFLVVDLHDMSAGVLAALDFCHDIPARHILA
ncbi:hypothetical protein CP97_14665 [Aurantiacibacter atlanticus]|uniref:Uncharacterized protein n=1 Tax=Aurantiacibacter atlanticus TaxID=1648404 RepID=A0A161I440_9SPHN|nr:hypothetical protein CP97_14665 [Aurantiacibacter atlanticus]